MIISGSSLAASLVTFIFLELYFIDKDYGKTYVKGSLTEEQFFRLTLLFFTIKTAFTSPFLGQIFFDLLFQNVYTDVEHSLNKIDPPLKSKRRSDNKIRPVGVIDKKASKKAGKKIIVDKLLSQSLDIEPISPIMAA
jgi:hypothetical protein